MKKHLKKLSAVITTLAVFLAALTAHAEGYGEYNNEENTADGTPRSVDIAYDVTYLAQPLYTVTIPSALEIYDDNDSAGDTVRAYSLDTDDIAVSVEIPLQVEIDESVCGMVEIDISIADPRNDMTLREPGGSAIGYRLNIGGVSLDPVTHPFIYSFSKPNDTVVVRLCVTKQEQLKAKRHPGRYTGILYFDIAERWL